MNQYSINKNIQSHASVIFDANISLFDILRCIPHNVDLKSTQIRPHFEGQIILEFTDQES